MMDVGIVEHMERNCGFSIDQIAERLPPTDQRYKSGTMIFTMKKASKKAVSNNRLGFPHPGILWISEICPTVLPLDFMGIPCYRNAGLLHRARRRRCRNFTGGHRWALGWYDEAHGDMVYISDYIYIYVCDYNWLYVIISDFIWLYICDYIWLYMFICISVIISLVVSNIFYVP